MVHIYNLRSTRQYESGTLIYTNDTDESASRGKPGYIRVDSVHRGDLDKVKSVYYINLVDEVTQTEMVMTLEGLSDISQSV